jgi:glycosyltransferase involved in cell wall biosynthesis/Tfp pilus assembly protein PilF
MSAILPVFSVRPSFKTVMRIHFQHTVYSHWGKNSGYPRFIEHLNPAGYEARISGTPDREMQDALPEPYRWLQPSMQNWIRRRGRLPWYKVGDLAAELEAYEHCRQGDIDVVHFLDGEHSAQFLPRAVRKTGLSKVRTVATFHQPPEWAEKIIAGELLKWLDGVLVVSPSQLPFFRRFVAEDRLHVILHGIDTDFFTPAPRTNSLSDLRCIIAGQWLRDWATFKAVARALPDIAFDAVTGSNENFDELPNVTVYRGVSDAKLAELYQKADVLFLPLIESTANNTLLEGMASGLAVVTSDLESVRAYLPNGEARLVANSRVEDFVKALRELQQDPERRQEMGRRARVRAEALSWPQVAKEFEQFYERLASMPSVDGARSPQDFRLPASSQLATSSSRRIRAAVPALSTKLEQLLQRGYAFLKHGYYDDARMTFKNLVEIFPDDSRGHEGLAYTAERQWNWTAAIRYWDHTSSLLHADEQATPLARKADCLIQIGAVPQARAIFGSLEGQFESLTGRARLSQMEGSLDAALALWEQCTIYFPDQIHGFLGKAALLQERGDYEHAERLLSQVTSIWPRSVQAGLLSAKNAVAMDDAQTAHSRWNAILDAYPDCIDVRAEFGRYLASSAYFSEEIVRTHLEERARTAEDAAAFILGCCVAREDFNAAAAEMRRFVEWEPENPTRRLLLATLLSWDGEADELNEAASILHELLKLSPNSVSIKIRLAEVYVRLLQYNEAIRDLETLPEDDNRIEVRILRLGRDTLRTGCPRPNNTCTWRNLFIDFEMLCVRELFSDTLPHHLTSLSSGDTGR